MQALGRTVENSIRSYTSVPMPPSSYRVRATCAPWLSLDPVLKDDCSTAVRAFHLVMFALFALFVAPLKSRAVVVKANREAGPQSTCIASREQHDRLNGGMVLAQRDKQKGFSGPTANTTSALTGRVERAVNSPRRDAPHLAVKRDHGPPITIHLADPHPHGPPALLPLRAPLPQAHHGIQIFTDRRASRRSTPLGSFAFSKSAARPAIAVDVLRSFRLRRTASIFVTTTLRVSALKTTPIEGDHRYVTQ
jgi:hypothetical protein